MKKKRVIGCTGALVYLAYAILTGGVTIDFAKGFGGQRNVVFAPGLKSDVWIDPNRSGGGIPFIGFLYFNRLPCGLRVQIWDRDEKYTRVTIETATVAYRDGEKSTFQTAWTRDLRPYTQVNSSSKGIIKTTMMMLSDNTPAVIKRHADCDVTLTGFLTDVDGERMPFEVVETFEYESDVRIYTLWQMLANV